MLQRGAPSAKRFYTRGGSGGATTKSSVSSSFAKNPDAAEAVPLLLFVSAGLFCFVSEYFLTSRDRSVRGIGVHVATNRKLARVLREQNGKTTRHRRAREREIDAREELVQSQSEKIFWGEE